MFACPIKEYGPFSNIYLKALNLSKSYIKQWFTANRRGKAINIDEKNPSTSTLYIKV